MVSIVSAITRSVAICHLVITNPVLTHYCNPNAGKIFIIIASSIFQEGLKPGFFDTPENRLYCLVGNARKERFFEGGDVVAIEATAERLLPQDGRQMLVPSKLFVMSWRCC